MIEQGKQEGGTEGVSARNQNLKLYYEKINPASL